MNNIISKNQIDITEKDFWQAYRYWEEFRIKVDDSIEEVMNKNALKYLKFLLEQGLETEMKELVGAGKWTRDDNRIDYRNGYYRRSLWTKFGLINDLKVPRAREVKKKSQIIKRYKSYSSNIEELVMNIFLEGVSTRRVKEVLKPLYGEYMISASKVSMISKKLNSEIKRYHERAIEDKYKYLILDGIYLKMKDPIKSRRRCVLVCYGICEDGSRELVDFMLSYSGGESENAWGSFLNLLYHRGLEGKKLKLVIIDGNKGLYNAIKMVWPFTKIQRCWAQNLQSRFYEIIK